MSIFSFKPIILVEITEKHFTEKALKALITFKKKKKIHVKYAFIIFLFIFQIMPLPITHSISNDFAVLRPKGF